MIQFLLGAGVFMIGTVLGAVLSQVSKTNPNEAYNEKWNG